MRTPLLPLIITALRLAQLVSGGMKVLAPPGCFLKCWDYSKILSSCLDATHCLCTDEPYQMAVYQCLNSQCETSQLAPALHHALSVCYPHQGKDTLPPLIRRSEVQGQPIKGGFTASATQPAFNRYSASVPYNRPMRSARRVWSQAPGSRLAKPTPAFITSSTPCPSTTLFAVSSPTPAAVKMVETNKDGQGPGAANHPDDAYSHDQEYN